MRSAPYASRRIPKLILPSLVTHMAEHAQPGADGLVFVGPKGSALRRSNFDKMVRWRDVAANVGIPGLRFHDLRHTGNTLAAPYASTCELIEVLTLDLRAWILDPRLGG